MRRSQLENFGLGLIVSEMVNPKRVQGFLDVSGHWDPTLLLVMVGALPVTSLGYKVILWFIHHYLLKKETWAYLKSFRQGFNMIFIESSFTRKYTGYHRFRTNLRQIGSAKVVLIHQ